MRSVPQSVRSVQFADMSAGALDRSYWLNEDDRFRLAQDARSEDQKCRAVLTRDRPLCPIHGNP
jgi:hypothetical protein